MFTESRSGLYVPLQKERLKDEDQAFSILALGLAVDEIFEDHEPTLEEMKSMVNVIGKPHVFSGLVSSLLSNETLMQETEENSYLHESAFERISLWQGKEYDLLLNVWKPEDQEICNTDPHDHRRKFAARILHGSITNHLHVVSTQGRLMQEYFFSPKDGVQKETEVYLQEIDPRGFRIGRQNAYAMPEMLIHHVTPDPKEITASLNLRAKPTKEYARFFREISQQPSQASRGGINARQTLESVSQLVMKTHY